MCVRKGELAGFMVYSSWPITSQAIVASFGDICTGSMWQCESTTWGSYSKNTPSFKEEFSVLFTGPVAVLQRSQPSCYMITSALSCLGSNAECCLCSGHFVSMECLQIFTGTIDLPSASSAPLCTLSPSYMWNATFGGGYVYSPWLMTSRNR